VDTYSRWITETISSIQITESYGWIERGHTIE
jgi:hypothetical protein